MIVLDTNVVSELMRPAPANAVVGWLRSQQVRGLRTTAVTVAEVGYGIERLPEGRRREQLQSAAAELFARFADQILAFDASAAGRYGELVAARDRAGRPIDGFDAQIAAICLVGDLTLATRNTRDFDDTGIAVVDPWSNVTA